MQHLWDSVSFDWIEWEKKNDPFRFRIEREKVELRKEMKMIEVEYALLVDKIKRASGH